MGLYTSIGERLKHVFKGYDAWIISYHDECFDKIGLKPAAKIALMNGALDCEFRKYEIFDGKYKEFKRETGGLKRKKKNIQNYPVLSNQMLPAKKRKQKRIYNFQNGGNTHSKMITSGKKMTENLKYVKERKRNPNLKYCTVMKLLKNLSVSNNLL